MDRKSITGFNGYALAQRVRQKCMHKGHNYKATDVHVSQLYTSSEPRVDYCPIWKVGTTFLKRVFMIKNLDLYANITNPYDISFLETYNAHRGAIIGEQSLPIHKYPKGSCSFVILTRDYFLLISIRFTHPIRFTGNVLAYQQLRKLEATHRFTV